MTQTTRLTPAAVKGKQYANDLLYTVSHKMLFSGNEDDRQDSFYKIHVVLKK